MNQHTLFTQVHEFYEDLISQLGTAQESISLVYLSFDSGKWADRISDVLCAKASAGISVRLMVDEFGQVLDEPRHAVQNIALFSRLRSCGVQVDVFRPGSPLRINNRLHCKIAAIDGRTVYLGGSNVGDYYTRWIDSNLRVDGELGTIFHDMYEYLRRFSRGGGAVQRPLTPADLMVGTDRLWLTIPEQRYDIREALISLIHGARKSLFLRTWYFLPDKEMLDALCSQARNGVQVNVLLSHETRMRPVDFANHIHVHKLVCAGGNVHRYTGKYMHSKAAWNDQGEVLFGSANLDPYSMRFNFESALQLNAPELAWELRRAFYADLDASEPQTPESHPERPLADRVLSQAFNLASPWL